MTVAKALPADLIDSLLSGYKKPEDLIGENGLLKQLTKALVESALDAKCTSEYSPFVQLVSAIHEI